MEFEQAYESFLTRHIERRTGERKGRLLSRNFHAEKLFLRNVWWPLKGNLEDLHPEYEIMDWRGRSYFADFAWTPSGAPVFLWEIKGFAKHVRDMDRNGYSGELNRELFLQGLGYRVASFAYDDVEGRPELVITLLRLLPSQFQGDVLPVKLDALAEREIIRMAIRLARPFRPVDVTRHLSINYRTTMKHMNSLVVKGWVRPVATGNGERIVWYALAKEGLAFYLD
ncbi:hypothetical protein COLU111180_20115 [Cohnella lubricantis]|uniref:DUF559 domain-containing protein n=1 Tax=Cohnella lubricantis TaxID=2163172 RepID=A0A841TCL5_9BACL|nr:hypothetical protein [Cohnella lubricantis]MBB6678752.1 hypothetical protein [Cohnella lubricantis]MBP2119820.1 hypothetical protein [Cohnella lubricantis]